MKPKNELQNFEKIFSSMWKTAKEKKVTRKTVAEEIEKIRKNVNPFKNQNT